MAFDLTGRHTATLAVLLLVSVGLSACTTTEGTNAFTSPQTFETEVMDKTAQGLGLIPAPVKPDPTNPRGPLVIPRDTNVLPPPETDTKVAELPVDNSQPQIDTNGLSQSDIERLRHVRVVDVNTPRRPSADRRRVADADLAHEGLHAQFEALDLHPARAVFLGRRRQKDLVCLAKDGDLVSVNDPNCPLEIRNALLKKS